MQVYLFCIVFATNEIILCETKQKKNKKKIPPEEVADECMLPNYFFTITADILARSLANFYR